MRRIILLCCLLPLLGNGKADGKKDSEQPGQTPDVHVNSPAERRPNPDASSGDRVYTVSVVNDNSWHFWLPLGFTAAVAIGGFYSIRLLWRQTVASTKAANAASLSAEAVLNGERAWLIVNLDALSTESFLKRVRTEGERATRELKLAIKNVGRTPSQISSISARAVLVEYGSAAREEPEYGPAENWAGRLLVPMDSVGHFVMIETEYQMTELYQQMSSGQMTIFVYGYVRYADVYGRAHETCFGLRRRLKWSNAALGPTILDEQFGPPEYNSAT
jgi:hypothetical protein